ncbi:TIGR00153 family protein [Magnetospira sp. QH-2]|uniref:TIGR00153 family protein n=1 Tax=Magnetospira sp. (strain QH-2) TaxID=1288970 RepID=UPI0005F9F0B0|nr:TIGR00153 family protein [Magnetospira sp. QH-2]
MVTNPLTSLFGRSPFKQLQNHMLVSVQCSSQVPDLFVALFDGNSKAVEEVRDRIFALEEEADKVKEEMRSHLPKSLLMPVNRGDLLDLLHMQDEIAGVSQDIAGFLMTRTMPPVEELKAPLIALAQKCADTCAKAGEIVALLDELVEVGFGGGEADNVHQMVHELSKIESETDRLAIEAVKVLFANEDKMGPVDVVFWNELIKWTSNLGDNAEHVGNRLLLLIAR